MMKHLNELTNTLKWNLINTLNKKNAWNNFIKKKVQRTKDATYWQQTH
jgi:hypothetical protein